MIETEASVHEARGHKTTVVPVSLPGQPGTQWVGRCSCRHVGKISPSHHDALVWGIAHLAEIERLRMHASRRPSLKDQRDYFRERSGDEALTDQERTLWTQLADELDARIGDREQPHTQDALF